MLVIKTKFNLLDEAMNTVNAIVADKLLNDNFRNAIFRIKEDKVQIAAFSGNITSLSRLEAEVIKPEGYPSESFVQFKAKEIMDVLSAFKGLRKTKVEDIEFQVTDTQAVMFVHEVALDDEMENADKYNQVSRFRITMPRIEKVAQESVSRLEVDVAGEHINTEQFLIYVNSLLPTVAKETRESTSNIMFGDDLVYTALANYTAVMDNKLPDVLKGFRLKNSTLAFVKNFIEGNEEFEIKKDTAQGKMVVLTIKVGDSVASIQCADMSRALDMTNYIKTSENRIAVDKDYLFDVLKRVGLDTNGASVEVNFGAEGATMTVASKQMKQDIPIERAKGEGSYSFVMKADLFASLIFSHMPIFTGQVYLYFGEGKNGTTEMSVKDNTGLWHTKIMGMSPARADYAWT